MPRSCTAHWLELVDTDGPFLAIPPLKRVWPQGMPSLPDERKEALVDARKDFEAAWETLDRAADQVAAVDAYRVARDKWVETVCGTWPDGPNRCRGVTVPGVQAQSPNRVVTVTAQAALTGPDGIGALVHVVDPVESLRQTPNDLWAATPVDRMEALAARQQRRDRHRHRRSLVGAGVRPAGQHGRIRRRRRADLDRGAANPGRVPDHHRPPVHHRR